MARQRHLENAPITEAIVDFRTKSRPDFKPEEFRRLKTELSNEYPVVEERFLVESTLEIKGGQHVSQFTKQSGLNGFWFKSSDGLNIAQFMADGFTFSRLKPYTSWQKVFPEAWKLWQLYVEVGSAEFVTRLAVRNINRLTLAKPITDLGEHLTAPPKLPQDISGNLVNFITRTVTSIPETGLTANVTQALERSIDPRSLSVILDIDTYKKSDFEIEDKRILRTFEDLHDFKNQVFFASITEETARILE